METALRTRLKNNAGVSALVGTRIDWGVRPQNAALPCIVLTIVADQRPQHMGGLMDSRATRVQIDCYGQTRASAVALREAVIAAILPQATVSGVTFQRAFIDTVRNIDAQTDTGVVFRDMIDAQIWHNA